MNSNTTDKRIVEAFLIAKFMGYTYESAESEGFIASLDLHDYSTDWSQLMPVVDDIYYSRRFDTGVQSSEISSKPVRLYANIKAGLLNLSIEQTHTAVIKFIEYYNNNQTSQK